MKYLKLIVVPLVLYMVGTMFGPTLGSFLVKEAKEETTLKQDVKVLDTVFSVNLAEMRDNELPEQVKTKGQVKLPSVSGDGTKMIASGRTVNLLNRNGTKLIIETTDGSAKGEVDISQTDIFDVIGRAKMDALRASIASGGAGQAAPKVEPTKPAAVAPPVKPVTQPEKPIVAAKVDPVPEPTMPTPPAADPEPADDGLLTPEQIVEVMKESIGSGAVKEFELKQVEAWKAGEVEDFGGEEYQTGLAAYKAETIFGVKTVQAKALIKGKKVTKWVYAKTGMEIR